MNRTKNFYRSKQILFLLIWVLASCQNSSETQPSTDEKIEEPAIIYQAFFVNVDNLRVRESPNLKSKVLVKLREGKLVYSENNVSDKVETVTLRGNRITSPYYYIKDNGDIEGWVFGGALTKIYQDIKPSPFTSRIEEVISKLRAFDYKDQQSGVQLLSVLREFKGSDPVWNDALYTIGSYFLNQLPEIIEFDQKVLSSFTTEDYQAIQKNSFDFTSRPDVTKIVGQGYRLVAAEGIIYAERDGTKISSVIQGPFSNAMMDHLQLYNKTLYTRITEDGAIVLELKELVDLTIKEEEFINKYPNHLFIDHHKKNYKDFMAMIINGMNNTPVKSYETNEVNENFKDAWKYCISRYPDSDLSIRIEEVGLI